MILLSMILSSPHLPTKPAGSIRPPSGNSLSIQRLLAEFEDSRLLDITSGTALNPYCQSCNEDTGHHVCLPVDCLPDSLRIDDINMIYAYGITTAAVFGRETDPDKPLRLVIDISKAEKADSFSIMEVAQAAATCIRDRFPRNPDVPLMLKTKDKEIPFEPPFAANGDDRQPQAGKPGPPDADKQSD